MSRLMYVSVAFASALVLSLPQVSLGATGAEQRVRSRGGSSTSTGSTGPSGRATGRVRSPRSGARSPATPQRRAPATRATSPTKGPRQGTRKPGQIQQPSRRPPTTRNGRTVAAPGNPNRPESRPAGSIRRSPRDASAGRATGSAARERGSAGAKVNGQSEESARGMARRGPSRIVEFEGAESPSRAFRVGSSRTSSRQRSGTAQRAAPSAERDSTARTRRRGSPTNVVGRAVPRPPLSASPGYSKTTRSQRGTRTYGRGVTPGYRTASTYGYRYGYDAGRVRFARPIRPSHRHLRYGRHSHAGAYGSFFYFPGYSFNIGIGYGYPGLLSRYGYSGYAYFPYGYASYGYSSGAAYAYTGSVRLKVKPRDAQVFVDGYYVGLVDHFDGFSQRLRLEGGTYRIQIEHPDYLPIELDVLVVAGETVTFEDYMERP